VKVSSKRFKLSCQKFLETFAGNFDKSFLAATLGIGRGGYWGLTSPPLLEKMWRSKYIAEIDVLMQQSMAIMLHADTSKKN